MTTQEKILPIEALSRTIDISRISDQFRLVNYANYFMLIFCGGAAIGGFTQLFVSRTVLDFVSAFLAFVVLGFSAWVGWKNIGVLGAVIHGYTRPAMLLLAAYSAFIILASWRTLVADDADRDLFVGVVMFALLVPVSLGGLLALTLLGRARIQELDVNLRTLILQSLGAKEGAWPHRLPPASPRKGTFYGLLGVGWLLGLQSIPSSLVPASVQQQFWRIAQVGYYFLIYARHFFQPSFETVMTNDKRSPVVFLRSFADDEKLSYNKADSALFDFSLESRLASHFNHIGPFIAVGAPGDKEPHLGAVRASLSDDKWQGTVLEWIERASLIIVMIGTTHWIAWELKKVVDLSFTEKLVVIFPQTKKSFWKGDTSSIERLKVLGQVFSGTLWEAGLSEIIRTVRPERVRSVIFRANGRVLCVTSRPRNRESYHLAALISQKVQLQDQGIMTIAAPAPEVKPRRWWHVIAWVTASAGAIFILLMVLGFHQLKQEMAFEPLPPSVQVTKTGALEVGNFHFVEQRGGAARPAIFKPGEEVQASCDIQGYHLGSDGYPDVELKAVLLDSSGAPTSDSINSRFHQAIDDGNRINFWYGWRLVPSAASGDYQIDVVVHDRVADSSLSFRPTFHLDQAPSK